MVGRLAASFAVVIGLLFCCTPECQAKGPKARGRGAVVIHGKGFRAGFHRPPVVGHDLQFLAHMLPWFGGYDHFDGAGFVPPPIDVIPYPSFGQAGNAAMIPQPNPAAPYYREAEDAFRAGQYEQAVRLAKHAIIETPQHGRLHELLSQALFAVGDYRASTAALQTAISLSPQGDWGFLVRNHARFYRGQDYAQQLGRLNRFVGEYPTAADARLLRAYHHGFLGRQDVARQDLDQLSRLRVYPHLSKRLRVRFGISADNKPIEWLPPPLPEIRNE